MFEEILGKVPVKAKRANSQRRKSARIFQPGADCAYSLLTTHADMRERTEKPEHVQQPQNHGDNHHAVQDRFYRPLHWYEAINQPKDYTNHDQHYHYVYQWHQPATSLLSILRRAFPPATLQSGFRSRHTGYEVGPATKYSTTCG